jgi:hypothetical protein
MYCTVLELSSAAIALSVLAGCGGGEERLVSTTSSATPRPHSALAAPLLPAATQTASSIVLANELLELSLDPANGSIQSLTDRATGTNLIGGVLPSVNTELWGFGLTGDNSTSYAGNWSSAAPTVAIANSPTEASVTLVWHGLNLTSGARLDAATIAVKVIAKAGDALTHWSFEAHGLGGMRLTRVNFPTLGTLSAISSQGTDNFLVLPEQGGRLANDPVGTRVTSWLEYPSASMSMQFSAFYNSQAGLFFGSQDTGGQTKAFSWSPNSAPANTANWHLEHMFPDQPTNDVVVGYDVVLGVFHGDWTAAADIYKAWARQQEWAHNIRPLPEWFREMQYGTSQCVDGCGFPSTDTYDTLVAVQSANAATLGSGALVFVSGWEKGGAWEYGDTLPPTGGWTAFDAMVSGLHASGNRVRLDVGAQELDAGTPLFASGTMSSSIARAQDGSPFITQLQIGSVAHPYYHISPTSQAWGDLLADEVAQLAAHGADSISFDGWPISSIDDDYSPGHPSGRGGNWQWQAWKTLLARVEAGALAIRDGITFSTEEGHELLLPYVTFMDKRDAWAESLPYAQAHPPIPLFSYVYKPYVQSGPGDYWPWILAGNPDTYHLLVFGRSLVWGSHLPFQYARMNVPALLSQRALDYYVAAGRKRSRYSKFLIDGSMLPPPVLSTSSVLVEGAGDGFVGPLSVTADAIQAGAWLSSDGETAVFLTNIGSQSAGASVLMSPSRLKLAASGTYSVVLETDSGTECLGAASATTPLQLTLAPQQIVALRIAAGPCSGVATTPSDCLFNWAEINFPALFAPRGAASQQADPYYYRHYEGTQTYLGSSSADRHVYFLDAAGLHDVGELAVWLTTAGCSAGT